MVFMTQAACVHTLTSAGCMCFILGKDYLGGEWKGLNQTYFKFIANQMLLLMYPCSNQ